MSMLPHRDAELIQIMDGALADATERSGRWLACRPGCNQCCTGVFRISGLDVERLQAGFRLLLKTDPEAAQQLYRRWASARERLSASFPGDSASGVLAETEAAAAQFEAFANDEVCPVLDPLRGTCTLYAYRPMTCRTFGPPTQTEDGALGVCELCFVGASTDDIKEAELHLPPASMESALCAETGRQGDTIVAFALPRES